MPPPVPPRSDRTAHRRPASSRDLTEQIGSDLVRSRAELGQESSYELALVCPAGLRGGTQRGDDSTRRIANWNSDGPQFEIKFLIDQTELLLAHLRDDRTQFPRIHHRVGSMATQIHFFQIRIEVAFRQGRQKAATHGRYICRHVRTDIAQARSFSFSCRTRDKDRLVAEQNPHRAGFFECLTQSFENGLGDSGQQT